MIKKDVCSYLIENFSDKTEPISILSKSDKGKVLVNDETSAYSYDKITKQVYGYIKYPTSADALFVNNKIILFTEFKSGFKRNISKETLNYNMLTCPSDSAKICRDYAKLLIEKGRLETDELLDSIKFKAIESYITLEKKILPSCSDFLNDVHLRVIFCVVVDDYIDSMEDTLTELASKPSSTNTFSRVKSSLLRFVNLKTFDNEDYFYDEIKVLSPYEYKKYLNSINEESGGSLF